jgi:hypothetical protein
MTSTNTLFGAAAAAGLETTPLTASTALAEATGSGAAFLYEVGSAATINLTAPNSTVGGVATFVASNHGAGAKLLVSDSAAGQWDVSEVGAPASRTLARYSVSGVAAGVSLVVGPNILPIGSLVTSDLISSGQSVAGEHDPLGWRTANQITVSKAGRYRIDLNAVHSTDNLSGASNQDAVGVSRAGIRINGTAIEWIGMDDTAGLADQMSGFVVRSFALGDAIDVVVNATSAAAGEDFYVSFAMEEQPSTESVQAGTIVPTPLTYAYLRRDINGATSNSLNFQAVAVSGTADTTIIPTTARRMVLSSPMASSLSGVSVASDQLVVSAPGRYEVVAHVDFVATQTVLTGRNTFIVVKNGSAILDVAIITSDNNGIGYQVSHLWEGDLAAGDVIDFRGDGQVNFGYRAYSVQLRQLPSSTVVDPDAVPVTDLHHASINGFATGTINGGTIQATTSPAGPTGTTLLPTSSRIALTAAGLTSATVKQNVTGMTVGTHSLTAEQDGKYSVDATSTFTGSAGSEYMMSVVKNGVTIEGWATGLTSTSVAMVTGNWTIDLVAGDTIDFRVAHANVANPSVRSFSVRVAQQASHSIVKYTPGDVVVTTLNKFEARKTAVGNQSIPQSVNTDIEFGVLVASEGSGYNPATSVFTAPSAGWYSFDAAVRMDFNTSSSLQEMFITIVVNGVEKSRGGFAFTGANANATSFHYAQTSVSVPLAVGDQVKVQCRHDTGSARLLNNSSTLNYFCGVQSASATAVDPGTVPVNTLTYGRMAKAAFTRVTVAVGTTIAGWDVSGPNNSGVTVAAAAGTMTITQAGLYQIRGSMSPTSQGNASYLGAYVNGVLIGQGTAFAASLNGETMQVAVNIRAPLSVGDVVTLRPTGITGGSSWDYGEFIVEQIPTSTVVNPGTVPVLALHRARLSHSALSLSVALNAPVPFNVAGPNDVGITSNTTTGRMTIAQAGTYRVTATATDTQITTANTQFGIYVNGVLAASSNSTNTIAVAQGDMFFEGPLVFDAGDVVDMRPTVLDGASNAYSGASLYVEQIATHSVIQPGATAVNDQPASGYRDIGNTRECWGSGVSGTAITFPAPFANATYAVHVNAVGIHYVAFPSAKLAAGFTPNTRDITNNAPTPGTTVDWRAIGAKPV